MNAVLHHLCTTTTKSGLTVTAKKVDKIYEKGIKISPAEMNALNLEYGAKQPRWNYTIKPQSKTLISLAN